MKLACPYFLPFITTTKKGPSWLLGKLCFSHTIGFFFNKICTEKYQSLVLILYVLNLEYTLKFTSVYN